MSQKDKKLPANSQNTTTPTNQLTITPSPPTWPTSPTLPTRDSPPAEGKLQDPPRVNTLNAVEVGSRGRGTKFPMNPGPTMRRES